jgi:hypothetical protein
LYTVRIDSEAAGREIPPAFSPGESQNALSVRDKGLGDGEGSYFGPAAER